MIRRTTTNLRPLYRKLFLKLWRLTKRYPNAHLSADTATLRKIPLTPHRAHIRPSASDLARVSEFSSEIYISRNYLHQAIARQKPRLLLDIGANIGLSTLAVLSEFPSLTKIVGIEAEEENWKVLKKNYQLWSTKYPDVEFVPIHAIASADEDIAYSSSKLSESSEYTASGTFKFVPADDEVDKNTPLIERRAITIDSLLENIEGGGGAICKLDIEGGEQYLLAENTEWLSEISLFSVEVHDRYDPSLLHSSQNLLSALHKFDFAIVPEKDILHCYARKFLTEG